MCLSHRLLFRAVVIPVASMLLSSCGMFDHLQLGGMEPVKRTPPAKAIVLAQPVQHKIGFGAAIRYPAGEYSPSAQNEEGTFYKASAPPRTVESARWMERDLDGGLYLRDDGADGLHYWNLNGEIVAVVPFSRFKLSPAYELKR